MSDALLRKLTDDRLHSVAGYIHPHNTDEFPRICADFHEYDERFLWVICYAHEGNAEIAGYINANYEKNHQILDSGFLSKLVSRGNFHTHMWEMVLCDTLSAVGKLVPKEKSGADFLLELPDGRRVQVEAVTPDEAQDASERAPRPTLDEENNVGELSGEIENMERPILLRFIKKFDDKHAMYNRELPLIIAINTSKTVGFMSDDNYVLRRNLFGLGYVTITKTPDGHITGFQQNQFLNKPGSPPFTVGRFRDPDYAHVSGVIYSSQSPDALVPTGYGWHNQGITFVTNPLANRPANVMFPFFRELRCTNELYEEIDAVDKFRSTVIQ